jgi:hypothetical protein
LGAQLYKLFQGGTEDHRVHRGPRLLLHQADDHVDVGGEPSLGDPEHLAEHHGPYARERDLAALHARQLVKP